MKMLETSPLRVKNNKSHYSTAQGSKVALPARDRDLTQKYSEIRQSQDYIKSR